MGIHGPHDSRASFMVWTAKFFRQQKSPYHVVFGRLPSAPVFTCINVNIAYEEVMDKKKKTILTTIQILHLVGRHQAQSLLLCGDESPCSYLTWTYEHTWKSVFVSGCISPFPTWSTHRSHVVMHITNEELIYVFIIMALQKRCVTSVIRVTK